MYWIASSVALFFLWKYIELTSGSLIFSKLLPIVFVFIVLSMAFRIFSALRAFASSDVSSTGNMSHRRSAGNGGFFGGNGDNGSGSCGGDGGGCA
ncbi:hypothetical protein [Agaribacter marinus]|uniref:Uncharacterized protein n=1 Tax=Agaribacter marinus TaxID=1431249 RepID=A0AA37SU91_9ALTE|nr:hypothetical protein [Agaribacter marinus]GLR69247.1 hypothetical protein GCM10007852_01550 [Agaribacter marinus]